MLSSIVGRGRSFCCDDYHTTRRLPLSAVCRRMVAGRAGRAAVGFRVAPVRLREAGHLHVRQRVVEGVARRHRVTITDQPGKFAAMRDHDVALIADVAVVVRIVVRLGIAPDARPECAGESERLTLSVPR